MFRQDARAERPQLADCAVERGHEETLKVAPGGAPPGGATRRVATCLKDREMNASEVGGKVHGTIAVVLALQWYAEGAIEGRRLLRISREQHDRGHLEHQRSLADRSRRLVCSPSRH